MFHFLQELKVGYTHIHTHTHAHKPTHTGTHAYTHTHTHSHRQTHTGTHTHKPTHCVVVVVSVQLSQSDGAPLFLYNPGLHSAVDQRGLHLWLNGRTTS